MKFYKSPLTILSIILFVGGAILNIRMFVIEAWPTIMFFVIMGVGVILVIVDLKIRTTKSISFSKKIITQVSIAFLILFLLFFMLR